MSPVAVFVRTLVKSSAIFIGAAAIFLNPALEWRSGSQATGGSRGTAVSAGQAGSEAAIDGLIALLKDTDAGVRRAAVNALTLAYFLTVWVLLYLDLRARKEPLDLDTLKADLQALEA